MSCPRCGKENAADARYCAQCGQSLVDPGMPDATVYAGFWLRVAAVVVDGFVLGAAYVVLLVVTSLATFGVLLGSGDPDQAANSAGTYLVLWWIGWVAMPWLYAALFESSARQATPGKMAVRIKVTDLHGRRLSFARATGRYFAHWISGLTFGIGYVMVAFTPRRQALHDMVAGTLVVIAGAEPGRIAGAPPARPMSGWAIAALVLLAALVPAGILAAIAIPAYQDYTTRSQVNEGLMIAQDYKGAVQASFEANGRWPADLTALDDRFSLVRQVNSSRYVEAIEVSNGTIMITYGRGSNPAIQDYVLSLRPHLTRAGEIVWQCGNAELPEDAEPMDREADLGVTSLADKHLPAACRTGRVPG